MDDDNNKKWDEADPSRTPMTFRLFGRKRAKEGENASTPGCLISMLACVAFIGVIWLMMALGISPLIAVFLAFAATLTVSLGLITLTKWLLKKRKKKKEPQQQ